MRASQVRRAHAGGGVWTLRQTLLLSKSRISWKGLGTSGHRVPRQHVPAGCLGGGLLPRGTHFLLCLAFTFRGVFCLPAGFLNPHPLHGPPQTPTDPLTPLGSSRPGMLVGNRLLFRPLSVLQTGGHSQGHRVRAKEPKDGPRAADTASSA